MGINYRIRKNGKYYMVEKLVDNKRVGSKNLEPIKLWILLDENKVHEVSKAKVHKPTRGNKRNVREKYAQHILTELSENELSEYEANDLYELNK